MQDALDSVSEWSNLWGLNISPSKTSAIIFSNRSTRNPEQLKIQNTQIEYVTSVKFLGVIFDRRMTWEKQINYIQTRCRGDLQLLRAVSYCRWGSDLATLRKLYTALVRPKIEYGSFLFSEASKTNLNKLDRIQYACIRAILGALKSTPTYKLEVEADIMPLNIRRNLLLAQYGCRILHIEGHPVQKYVSSFIPSEHLLTNQYKFPALDRVHKELVNTNINPSSFPRIPLSTRYSIHSLPVYTSLASNKKSNSSCAQWSILFKDLVQSKYPNHKMIFTDGSCRHGSCGCGVWSETFKLMARLPDRTTIFSAELYAIYSAVKFISRLPGKFLIFSDSLGALQSLQSLDQSSHYLLFGSLPACCPMLIELYLSGYLAMLEFKAMSWLIS